MILPDVGCRRWFLVAWLLVPGVLQAAESIDYHHDIAPLLTRYCAGCHAADAPEGGLVLDSYQSLLAGGDTGLAITPGAASSSRLVQMVAGQLEPVMPPEGEARPTAEEIELLAAWIDQGAKSSDGPMPFKRDLRVPDVKPQKETQSPVTAVAYSPDGTRRAVARYGQITLLSEDDQPVATISTELHKVSSLEFSRDGTELLAASGVPGLYGNALLYNIETGDLVRELIGHRDLLYMARFSPDGTQIATAGYDRDIVLWDRDTGAELHRLSGHNGAVFDITFSPDGKVLATASADETVKIWNVDTGQRLDTLSQPEGEVLAIEITPDSKYVVAASVDNYLRVWRLLSVEKPMINPLSASRFLDESPLIRLRFVPSGDALVAVSRAGNVKLVDVSDWRQAASLDPVDDVPSDVSIRPDGKTATIALMNGKIVQRELPALANRQAAVAQEREPIYLELGPLTQLAESDLRPSIDGEGEGEGDQQKPATMPAAVGRGVEIRGVIDAPEQADAYQWDARAGEVWAIDGDAAEESPLDPMVTILDAQNEPVLRTRLQAIQETYFVFRGKNSSQSSDFRMFNWQELPLDGYLYASGEVTRLWMHPRGPDSGFNVYPGQGDRWTFFGTSHVAHALGEPAYIVRPLKPGQAPANNGLPTFDVYYQNDDDPMRRAGRNSRLLFTAPADGAYRVEIADTRGDGGEGYGYRLAIRPAAPSFNASVAKIEGELRPGTGREFVVQVDRRDGYDGPVTFHARDLPSGVVTNLPVTVEAGQQQAVGVIWIPEQAPAWDQPIEPHLYATADIVGRRVERAAGSLGELKVGDPPQAIPSLHPIDGVRSEAEDWTLQVHRGETVAARVVVRRQEGFDAEISFGKEFSGRNSTHGVYVDNIGLNGLRIVAGSSEREFFLTADRIATPGKRSFFLTAEVNGNVTTHPITVEVLP